MIKIAPHTYTIEETDPSPLPVPANAHVSLTVNHQLIVPQTQYTNSNIAYIQAPPNSTLYFYTPKQGHTGEAYNQIPKQSLEQNALHHQKHTIHALAARQQSETQNTTLAQEASTAWKTHVFANSHSTNLLPAKNTKLATIQSLAIAKSTPKALQMRIAAPAGQTLAQRKIALAWDEENKHKGDNAEATYNNETGEFNVIWRFSQGELNEIREWEERYGVLMYYVGYGSKAGKGGEVEVTAWSDGIGFGINKVPGKVLVLSMGV